MHLNLLTKEVMIVHESERIRTSVMLSSGETAVIRKANPEISKKPELLWILTPYLVRGKP
jgi:hypothetical protein